MKKPPLGVTPRYIHDERRRLGLMDAIVNYMDADEQVPLEWVEEYNELTARKETTP